MGTVNAPMTKLPLPPGPVDVPVAVVDVVGASEKGYKQQYGSDIYYKIGIKFQNSLQIHRTIKYLAKSND